MKNDIIFNENLNVLERINSAYADMSKNHKVIAGYIKNNLDKVSDLTISMLAEFTNTSAATVLRFAEMLGYEGYPEFKKGLRALSNDKLTISQRIDMPLTDGVESDIKSVFKYDIANIKATMDTLDMDVFNRFIDLMIKADKIYILSSRTSRLLAEYLDYYLGFVLHDKSVLIKEGIREPFEQLMSVKTNDVVLGLSFPRYSSKTIRYMEFCRARKVTVLGITDEKSSPIYPLCDHVLFTKSNIISFVDTLVAPMSMLNALIIGIGMSDKEKTRRTFEKVEEIWSENVTYDIYN